VSRRTPAFAFVACALALAGCERVGAPALPGVSRAPPPFDAAKLESAIDRRFGGVGTCVIVADTKSGREIYQYGSHTLCRTPLPPCSTFKIANGLIALDAGAVTPATVFKWDGTPQPVSAWERDADLKTAFKESIVWWFQRVARGLGKGVYARRLDEFGYGNEKPEGPVDRFWLGPSAGGGLTISTRQQAEFLHRFYAGRLPVKPETAAAVREIMVDETRGGATMSGKTGSCASNAENSRQVGWWVGRLQTQKQDYVFAASMEGANDSVLPGRELQIRVKTAFAQAGLWPSE
jgi:beta-lactamase class D